MAKKVFFITMILAAILTVGSITAKAEYSFSTDANGLIYRMLTLSADRGPAGVLSLAPGYVIPTAEQLAAAGVTETDPCFALWFSTFDANTSSETDPCYLAWYSTFDNNEVDPCHAIWVSSNWVKATADVNGYADKTDVNSWNNVASFRAMTRINPRFVRPVLVEPVDSTTLWNDSSYCTRTADTDGNHVICSTTSPPQSVKFTHSTALAEADSDRTLSASVDANGTICYLRYYVHEGSGDTSWRYWKRMELRPADNTFANYQTVAFYDWTYNVSLSPGWHEFVYSPENTAMSGGTYADCFGLLRKLRLVLYRRQMASVFYGVNALGYDKINADTDGTAYDGTEGAVYKVQITTGGATSPNVFKWSDNNGVTWTTGVNVSTSPIYLNHNIQVTFFSLTGHTIGDYWQWTATSTLKAPEVTIDEIRFIPVETVPRYAFTFDDGGANLYAFAAYLTAKGLIGTFYIIPSLVGTSNYLTLDQLKNMQKAGHLIANHGWSHKYFVSDSLTDAAYAMEITKATEWLCANGFSEGSRIYALPGGSLQWPYAAYGSFFGRYFDHLRLTGLHTYYRDIGSGISTWPSAGTVYCEQFDGLPDPNAALIKAVSRAGGGYGLGMISGWHGTSTFADYKGHVDAVAAAVAAGTIKVVTMNSFLVE